MIRINLLEKEKKINFFGGLLAEFSDWRQKRKERKEEKKREKEEKKRKRASLLERRVKKQPHWFKRHKSWTAFTIFYLVFLAVSLLHEYGIIR